MEPSSLKELLKRSDGASLSEILQQRNLSLTDLLNGKENAISALQSNYPAVSEKNTTLKDNRSEEMIQDTKYNDKLNIIWSEDQPSPTSLRQNTFSGNNEQLMKKSGNATKNIEQVKETKNNTNNTNPKIYNRRRFPLGNRRRQRIRNYVNNNSTALNETYTKRRGTERYMILKNVTNIVENNNNNNTKGDNDIVITSMPSITTTENNDDSDIFVTSNNNFKFTTNLSVDESSTTESNKGITKNITYSAKATTKSATITSSRNLSTTEIPLEDLYMGKTESTIPYKRPKISLTNSELRRQVLTNRLKKKRLKEKSSTADPLESGNDLFGMANLVSASEFIAKIQHPESTTPITTLEDNEHFTFTLDDITMPEDIKENDEKGLKDHSLSSLKTTTDIIPTTEETAKIEIEEILNDTNSKYI